MTGERELYAEEALEILKRISDEDCEKLGLDPRFCRPVLNLIGMNIVLDIVIYLSSLRMHRSHIYVYFFLSV
jgi:hypothetical protein